VKTSHTESNGEEEAASSSAAQKDAHIFSGGTNTTDGQAEAAQKDAHISSGGTDTSDRQAEGEPPARVSDADATAEGVDLSASELEVLSAKSHRHKVDLTP
jgi:hypothetical protein